MPQVLTQTPRKIQLQKGDPVATALGLASCVALAAADLASHDDPRINQIRAIKSALDITCTNQGPA